MKLAKVDFAPEGENLRISPSPPFCSATNRSPLESKARPVGCASPVAKVVLVPEGVYSKIVPVPPSHSYKLPFGPKVNPCG